MEGPSKARTDGVERAGARLFRIRRAFCVTGRAFRLVNVRGFSATRLARWTCRFRLALRCHRGGRRAPADSPRRHGGIRATSSRWEHTRELRTGLPRVRGVAGSGGRVASTARRPGSRTFPASIARPESRRSMPSRSAAARRASDGVAKCTTTLQFARAASVVLRQRPAKVAGTTLVRGRVP
jgi:hypothetical protein